MRIETQAIVYQRQTPAGVSETRATFQSMEELSRLCLEPAGSDLPSRVLLAGVDDQGRSFTLALSFACTIRDVER